MIFFGTACMDPAILSSEIHPTARLWHALFVQDGRMENRFGFNASFAGSQSFMLAPDAVPCDYIRH
jgi:hypothetical protein